MSIAALWARFKARVIAPRIERWKPSRTHQENLDTLKLAYCMSYFDKNTNNYYSHKRNNTPFQENLPTQEDENTLQRFSFLQLRDLLKDAHGRQVMHLFDSIQTKYKGNGLSPYPPNDKMTRRKRHYEQIDSELKWKDGEIYREGELIAHPLGFNLQIRKSKIDHPESGYGTCYEF